MKASELRIGNVVNYKGEPIVVTSVGEYGVQSIFEYHVINAKFSTPDLTPIPLTPEILLNCGFYQGEFQSGGYYGYSNGVLELDNDFNICLYDGRMDESETKIFVPETEYLHQLQNLYFALEGEELEVKL